MRTFYIISSLLYTSGYVARKTMHNTACTECKDLFGNKHYGPSEQLKYTKHLDREALIYPSNSLFELMQVAY